jgi:hypothetical protein
MAGMTRLELAASYVTGRRSNRSELHPRAGMVWAKRDSNPRHLRCKRSARFEHNFAGFTLRESVLLTPLLRILSAELSAQATVLYLIWKDLGARAWNFRKIFSFANRRWWWRCYRRRTGRWSGSGSYSRPESWRPCSHGRSSWSSDSSGDRRQRPGDSVCSR